MLRIFRYLVYLTLLTPFLVSKEFLFPFVTTKAFYFRIIIELALPFYLYLLVVKKDARPKFRNPLTILVVAFWAVNLVSSFVGVNLARSLWGNFERMGGTFYLLHLTLFYFYLLFLAQIKGKYFQDFLRLVVILASAIAIYSILTVWGMPSIIVDPSLPARASAFFGNPIYLGTFFVLTAMLTVWFALRAEKPWARYVYLLLALLQLLGLYLSGTRGAVLGLVLGGTLGLLAYTFFSKGRARIFSWSAVAVLVVLFGAIFFLSSRLPQVARHLRVFNLNDSNTQSRLIQWRTALTGFKDRPLLGTGPENYYLVANQYYNPEIAKYDRSWFDKPHNYILEILVTNGIFGLLVYLGLVMFSLLAVFRAFKKSFINLGEFCVLLAGLLAYQIQNLFVFENVSSSLLYYMVLALAAYLWLKVKSPAAGEPKPVAHVSDGTLAFSVFVVASCVCAYAFYAGNLVPAVIARNVNYGFAYSSVDPQKAYSYFHNAASLPFNIDPGETGSRYASFATVWAQNNTDKSSVPAALQSLNDAAFMLERAVDKQFNYPAFLTQLAMVYLVRGLQTDRILPASALEDVQKAISLAPNRTEARQLLIQIREYQQDWQGALALAKTNLELLSWDPLMLWQAAVLTRQIGNETAGVSLAEQALSKNFQPSSVSQIAWLRDYYNQKQAYGKSAALYEQLAKNNLLGQDDVVDLVKMYVQAGEKEKALGLAQKLEKAYPNLKDKVEAILKTVK
jgi:O-antigen ligase